jgi:hypothetical protein
MFAQICACYPARLTAKSGKLCLIMPVQSHPYMFIKYSYKSHIRAHRGIQASNTRAIYHYVNTCNSSIPDPRELNEIECKDGDFAGERGEGGAKPGCVQSI